MYNILRQSSDNKIGICFKGNVESRDFKTLLPFLEQAIQKERSLRILIDLQEAKDTDLTSILKIIIFGLKYKSVLEKKAVITDNHNILNLVRIMELLTRKKIYCFPISDSENAWEWLEK